MPIKKAASAPKKPLFEVGSIVTFDLDGTETQAEVTAIAKNGTLTINDGESDYEVPKAEYGDLTIVEAEEPEEEEVAEKAEKVVKKGKTKPTPAKSKVTGFGKLFKETEAAPEGGAVGFDEGDHEGFVVGGVIEGDAEAGEKVACYLNLVGLNDIEGQTARKYYNLLDETGEPATGLGYLKRDLAKLLNCEVDDINERIDSMDDLQMIFEEFAENPIWLEISVKPQRGDTGYMNYFFNDLLDQDNKPDVPAF